MNTEDDPVGAETRILVQANIQRIKLVGLCSRTF
jgi:hypothetical protein